MRTCFLRALLCCLLFAAEEGRRGTGCRTARAHTASNTQEDDISNFESSQRHLLEGIELIYASKKGDLAKVKKLLLEGADVHEVDKHGGTALHDAARAEHGAIVSCLIEAKADILGRDSVSVLKRDA